MLSTLRPGIRPADLRAAVGYTGLTAAVDAGITGPTPLSIASPWAPPNNLASVVWADIFGTRVLPVTRAEAMSVPAAARARHVLCSTVARTPLGAYRGYVGDPTTPDQRTAPPSWVTSTGSALSSWHRMVWTVDDLIWYGWSAWSRTNGADGRPLRMDRIDPARWSVDSTGRVWVDQVMQRSDQVLLIPGPHEGLLTFAQDSIRHAADLQRAASRASKHPSAYMALKQTGGTPLPQRSDDPTVVTVETIIAGWAAAREGENGGVAWLNESVDAKELGAFDRHLVLDGRNAAAVDIARLASLPADLIDASTESSMTYSNARDNDRRGVDYGSGFYMGAISAALSQDAVMPAGSRIAFDVEAWLAATVPGQAPPPAQPVTPARPAPGTPTRSESTA